MPLNVEFRYVSTHGLRKNGGIVSCVPALTHESRLYVISNAAANNRRYYIGTAANLQHRFAVRLEAAREFGFRNIELNNVSIAEVRILINGSGRPPHNTGVSNHQGYFVDVEHILIRQYLNLGWSVRNVMKVLNYTNNVGTQLNCTFTNPAGWPEAIPGAINIPPGYYI